MDVAEHAPGAGRDRRSDRLGAPGARLNPAVAAVRNAVRAALAGLPPGSLVLVACSGGADSLALAAATAFVAPRTGFGAGAVVVDHGWSPGSVEVAAAVGRTCTGLGLGPVDVVRVSCEGPGGPEAAARTARYEALDGAAHRHGAAAVLLGHTRDDQAETVLLGLARGSGTRSLAGMPPARGILRRPLLGLGRDVTAAVCADLGLPVWTDPANSDPAFRRTRVRRLLPELDGALGPGLTAALARTAEIAREDADALDALAEGLFARASVDGVPGTGRVVLDAGVLAAESDAVRRRTVLLAARRAGSPAGALGRRHVLATDALITRWRGQRGTDLPGGVRAERACGRLVFTLAGDPDTDPPVARTNPDRE